MSSVSKPRVRHNRHKQGLNLTLEKLSADFRFNIIPVYSVTLFIDAIVFNTIEFWGDDFAAEPGETKIVKNGAGEDVMITTTEDGYNVSDGTTAMNFVFDAEQKIWSAEYNNQVTKLVKLNGDNTAQIFVGDDVVDVNLDAEGINMAHMLLNNSFAMNR